MNARREGFVTVQFAAMVALSLLLLVLLANLLLWSYGHGVVRAALDEGARAGARAGDPEAACASRARAVLDDLLGGPMGQGVGGVDCQDTGGTLRASVAVRFPGWLPAVPDWRFTASATAVREPVP